MLWIARDRFVTFLWQKKKVLLLKEKIPQYPFPISIDLSALITQFDFLRSACHNGWPLWGCSSVGRALRSQCRGREFDPPHLHHLIHWLKKKFHLIVLYQVDFLLLWNWGRITNLLTKLSRTLHCYESVQWKNHRSALITTIQHGMVKIAAKVWAVVIPATKGPFPPMLVVIT